MAKPTTLLRIDASARVADSVTRALGDTFERRWLASCPEGQVVRRDLIDALPQVNADWVAANFTDPDQRDADQRDALALSDRLIDELRQADEIVVGVPMYNFGVPASIKAWIDLVCRARETFAYSEQGPVGLLADRPVTLLTATGGVPVGSAMDFATGYMKHIFGFIGIRNVRLIAAERLDFEPEQALETAQRQLNALFDNPHRAA